MHDRESGNDGRPLLSNRTAEIVVALLLLAFCAVAIIDSMRLGFDWREGGGPAPGYFPFYVAAILGVATLVNLVSALRGRGAGEIFVSLRPFGRVLTVLVPSLVYVALIGGVSLGPIEVLGLGIYVASAIFVFAFMVAVGRESPLKATIMAAGVPVALFLLFEKWFLVPLPKGPLETWLGY